MSWPTLFLFMALLSATAVAQVVNVPVRHPVYDYLDRIEARYGVSLLQFSRPLPRIAIAKAIDSLARGPFRLIPYDKKQCAYYAEEFAEELRRLHAADTAVRVPQGERWNLATLRVHTPAETFLAADLVGRVRFEKREETDDLIARSNGVQVYGYVGRNLGAFMRWVDNGVKGNPLDPLSLRTPEQGVVKGPPATSKSYEFEVAEAQFFYSTPWLTVGAQKMDRWLGSGRDGAIILSDKSPSSPELYFRVALADWLHFEYSHAWLFSDVADSVRMKIGQKFYKTKYLAAHVLTARITPGLQLALGVDHLQRD
ncbi:MAG: hypothetical protein IPP94_14215 [Ignavibacteria bacterium]|nr:hypothetical protein [Ignavibacteria bacterium]